MFTQNINGYYMLRLTLTQNWCDLSSSRKG